MLASKVPSSASAYMNPALAAQFDYNGNLTEFHYILEDYVNLQEKLDRLEFASLQLEKQERLTEQVKEKLDNTYDRLSQITNKKKKEANKLEQLKHLTFRSFFSKIKGTRSSELVKAEKAYQSTCKQYEQAKKAFDVNKSLWDESKKELLECQANNKNFNRYKNELEELLQEVFDGPTPNFPQEDALEQQVMKLFLNFTQLSQVIHQCELAKDNLRNAHMYLVNYFKGNQSVRDYASTWDLSPTSVIKILKENEKHDDLTILSDAKDYVKQANEEIQHARVLLTKKTNLTSNKIERLDEFLESIVDSQEYRIKEGFKRIDGNLEKELGETRIWLGEEIQSLKHDYTKQEKELAVYKTKLFEERQRILNLWIVNLDDSIKKRMIENSSARGRKRSKSKILKSFGQEDESDTNWFDNSGITCAADLAIRNNTISRNASVKSSATLFSRELDSLKVGSCPASNGFYTLNNINQYMGNPPSIDYYHDPMFNSLPRWSNNSLYNLPDRINTSGMEYSTPSFKAQSEILKNNDIKFNDSHSQGENNIKKNSESPSHTLDNKSSNSNSNSNNSSNNNNNNSNSNSNSKRSYSNNNNNNSSIKHSSTRNSKRSIPTRSSTKNSHTSNHFGHATASAININGNRAPSLEFGIPNPLNNNSYVSLPSTPNSLTMMGGYPRIQNGNNYMYNRYSLDQYSLQAAYLPQYYSYNASASDLSNPANIFNPYVVSSSYVSNPLTSLTTTVNSSNMSIPATTMSPLNNASTINTSNTISNSYNNASTIQRSRSAIVSHVMDKPLNRAVVNDTINLHISSPSSSPKNVKSNSSNSSIPNIQQLQQSPMFPFPQRSRSVSAANTRRTALEEKKILSSLTYNKKNRSNTISNYKFYNINKNAKGSREFHKKHSFTKSQKSLEEINVLNSEKEEEEEEEEKQEKKSVEVQDKTSDDDSSTSSSSSSSSESSTSSSSSTSDEDEDEDDDSTSNSSSDSIEDEDEDENEDENENENENDESKEDKKEDIEVKKEEEKKRD
ncbi:hypothetical protein BCR32DRAFT_283334 [Anaeromyces robustus]|uniref:Uncharacterized protein n=1 Tax=Anaeromyces robustus TaxID=1754192 RepID=A0A1Y1WVG9_9FUNG|nr:hypothetical protein BCR32DRAFT_283334 [Anaeromyces robustus]|eukprot:ORX77298.1 hypothetical protein BCR32DRAFT_283334 [Anaeromyces robustus]